MQLGNQELLNAVTKIAMLIKEVADVQTLKGKGFPLKYRTFTEVIKKSKFLGDKAPENGKQIGQELLNSRTELLQDLKKEFSDAVNAARQAGISAQALKPLCDKVGTPIASFKFLGKPMTPVPGPVKAKVELKPVINSADIVKNCFGICISKVNSFREKLQATQLDFLRIQYEKSDSLAPNVKYSGSLFEIEAQIANSLSLACAKGEIDKEERVNQMPELFDAQLRNRVVTKLQATKTALLNTEAKKQDWELDEGNESLLRHAKKDAKDESRMRAMWVGDKGLGFKYSNLSADSKNPDGDRQAILAAVQKLDPIESMISKQIDTYAPDAKKADSTKLNQLR